MSKEHLPIYQIQDFGVPADTVPDFYLSRFERHLQKHTFIQTPHKHDFYIVLLITGGTGSHTIDFKKYNVNPNTVFFLSPNQVHFWRLSADAKGYIVFFSREFYLSGFPQKKMFTFPFFNILLHKPVVLLSQQEGSVACALFEQLEKEYTHQQWKYKDMIRNYLDILLTHFTRTYHHQNTQVLPVSERFTILQHLEELIEQHFKKHLPASFYAEKMHMTPKQINDNCKQSLGKTVSDLIKERLILEACRLLVHSDLTVTQISLDIGYLDNSYFARFFKKKTGQTPEQFRQNYA